MTDPHGSTKPCLFCGRTGVKLTLEHVIPTWLYRTLAPPGTKGPVVASFKDQKIREMRGFDLKLRAVCRECNNGWMHDLERAFRAVMTPAITGRAALKTEGPVILDRGAQQVVAAWAVKTWLLMELVTEHVRGGAVKAPYVTTYLYEHGQPPEATQVFLETVNPNWREFVTFRDAAFMHDGTPLAATSFLTIGKLLFYFFAPASETEAITLAGFRDDLSGAICKIWPYEIEEIRWPTAGVAGPDFLETLVPSTGTRQI